MEAVSWVALVPELGASALVTVFVLLVLTGRLVPGREMRYWREAFFEEQRQKRQLLDAGRVTQDVLQALPQPEDDE